jgi:membrane-associated phospholipid phosphatase
VKVWVAPHTHNRLFPITFFTSGDVVYPQFAYPYIEPIFSPAGAGLVAGLVPLGVVLIAQIWERSFFDFANAILGLAMSMAVGTTFQVILKKTIGGLRPHFLSVCAPVIPDGLQGVGFQNLMFTVDQVCTGDRDRIDNAIESFPSGHSNIAFAGLGYLAIYLFTHLRIQSFLRAGYWKMGFVFLPILMATYLASTLVLGYHHHGYDVIFGSLIGIVVSIFSYRMVFCSIHDRRWNTVPRRRFEREEKERGLGMGLRARDEEAKVGMSRPTELEDRRGSSGTAVGVDDSRRPL